MQLTFRRRAFALAVLSSVSFTPKIFPAAVTADHSMVVTANPIATEAAVETLNHGGNAIDAAIRAGLTLGVVDGFNSGIGGGCFLLIHLADGRNIAIDGREEAPAAATRDMYRRNGKADTTLSQTGALAIGVPGSVAAYHYAITNFGKSKWPDLVNPAADLAETGFPISEVYRKRLVATADDIARFPATAAILLKADGSPMAAGEVLRQADLAITYRAIAKSGPDAFYKGAFPASVEKWMKANGGIATANDFANYELKLREPLVSEYRGYKIIGFPPPSSGGVHVAEILNILSSFDLPTFDEPTHIHVTIESMKRAFADRAFWLGDPDFVPVPRGLLDLDYAKRQAGTIDLKHASNDVQAGDPPDAATNTFGKHTTHIAVADDRGNWVAMTQTVNTYFGSKVIVPGTGVILNNQMDDFSIQPGVPNFFWLVGSEANAVGPMKRPLSSMSPTIVLDRNSKPFLTVGAAGGPKIITQVLLVITNVIDRHDDLDTAMKRPRFHQQWKPPSVWIENTFDTQLLDQLKAMGHELQIGTPEGATQAIQQIDGKFIGVSEPRGIGSAAGN